MAVVDLFARCTQILLTIVERDRSNRPNQGISALFCNIQHDTCERTLSSGRRARLRRTIMLVSQPLRLAEHRGFERLLSHLVGWSVILSDACYFLLLPGFTTSTAVPTTSVAISTVPTTTSLVTLTAVPTTQPPQRRDSRKTCESFKIRLFTFNSYRG